MRLKPRKWVQLPRDRKLKIVADAAIASGKIGDGRLIPLIIVDTTTRHDVGELIRVHDHLPPGDVKVQWGSEEGSEERISLILDFLRPIESTVVLEFDVVGQGGLLDQILTAKVFYLQAGKEGDRFINTQNAPRIFVEVGGTGFEKEWDDIFLRQITKHMRNSGLGRQEAKRAAKQYIAEWRKFGSFRMPTGNS